MQDVRGALGRAGVHPARPSSPATPHFLAAPEVSNSRLHKFQAQPLSWREQRTFPQSSGRRKDSSKTSLVSSENLPSTEHPIFPCPAPSQQPSLASPPVHSAHTRSSHQRPSRAHTMCQAWGQEVFCQQFTPPVTPQSLSLLPLSLCTQGTEWRLSPSLSCPHPTGLGSPHQVSHLALETWRGWGWARQGRRMGGEGRAPQARLPVPRSPPPSPGLTAPRDLGTGGPLWAAGPGPGGRGQSE